MNALAILNTKTNYQDFAAFIEENQNSFYRVAYQYVSNRDTALDLVQEAIVKALSKQYTLRDISLIKPWFYRILTNECLGYLRKHKREILTDTTPESETAQTHPENDITQNMDLYRAIGQLSPELKTIIILRYFEDMKLEDVAKITNTNLNTVKTRLYRALKILKPMMQEKITE
ncbi:MAG: RNA polymerase sigma factor [Massiliimalia sp.]|jgi:RNA polymerase sigma-70 factor (ECF subfamily)